MSITYDREKRSRAAKWGWRMRRAGITPEMLAGRRLRALIRSTNARLARLLVCDLAQAVLPFFAAKHPDDTDVLTRALAVARRYANGTATDKERLKAQHTLTPFMRDETVAPSRYEPWECALGAVSFALVKEQCHFLEWGAYWAYIALHGRDDRYAFHLELATALEGLQVGEERLAASA